MTMVIRKATNSDFKCVYHLIREFAEFEKLLHEVSLTEQEFTEDGRTKRYECFVAVADENIVGYALYFHVYSSFQGRQLYLEDLYVEPSNRRKRVGQALFNAVIQELPCIESDHLRFACLKWNTVALRFYHQSGAVNMTQKHGLNVWRFDRQLIQRLADTVSKTTIGVVICKASVNDLPAVYTLTQKCVKSWSVMEHKTTVKQLERDGFGSAPYFECIVAKKGNRLLGYATFYHAYSTFQGRCIFIEELYVDECQRRQGIGSRIVIALAKECVRVGSCKLQAYAVEHDETAVNFYAKMAAENLTLNQQWLLFDYKYAKENLEGDQPKD